MGISAGSHFGTAARRTPRALPGIAIFAITLSAMVVGLAPPASALSSSLSLTKNANPTGFAAAGTVIHYSYVVTNTGGTLITGISVNDNKATVSCGATFLNPGGSTNCTATYTTTQADVDAGSVTNIATATGTDPTPATVTSNSPTVTVNATGATSSISLAKTAGGGYAAAGDIIHYSYKVTNTGTTTIHSIAVTDNKVAVVTCPAGSIAPGSFGTCTGNYTVTQTDVDTGSVTNTATANGIDPHSAPVVSNSSTVTDPANATSSLGLTKALNPPSQTYSAAGQTLNYSYQITNTGTTTITITANAVTDNKVTSVTCPAGAIAPTASVTCNGSYVTTQADVDAGSVTNSATASGTNPHGTVVTSHAATATASAAGTTSSISMVKTSSPKYFPAAGTHLTYSYAVTNTGTTTISGVTVTDATTVPVTITVTCPAGPIAPGATKTCTAPYTTTSTDASNGQVTNNATATGKDPHNVTVTATASLRVNLEGLTLIKSTTTPSFSMAGQSLSYSYQITNNGSVQIDSPTIHDNKIGTFLCGAPVIASGGMTTCSSPPFYVTTQADVDAGFVTNTATATGTDDTNPSITVTSNTSTTTVLASGATSSLSLVKHAPAGTYSTVGQVLAYTYDVTNTGTTTMSNITVSDNKIASVNCPVGPLAPGAMVTCSGSYTVTQADLDGPSIVNTATASGTNPHGIVINSNSDTKTVNESGAVGSLTLLKSTTSTGFTGPGQSIPYSYLVTNPAVAGAATVSGITVTDMTTLGAIVSVTCPAGSLAPGAHKTCTATYTTTGPDVTNGFVMNTATAHGTDSHGATITSSTSSTTVNYEALKLTKTATTPSYGMAGDVIFYDYTLQNIGQSTVSNPMIHDSKIGTFPMCTGAFPGVVVTTLGPGSTVTCTGVPYSVTQPDVDAGSVTNVATASGTDPNPVISNTATQTVPGSAATTSLSLVKTALSGPYSAPGTVLSYRYTVTNTGTTTISNIAVHDNKIPAITCPSATLPPTGSNSEFCTGTYTTTQADVDAGSVTNTASVSATDPHGAVFNSNIASQTVSATQTATLSLVKSSTSTGYSSVGQVIPYSYLVTNTGNVTIANLSITDNKVTSPAPTCPPTSLVPGATATCTGTYTVVAADVPPSATSIANTANAHGTAPGGGPVTSGPSTVTLPYEALTLTKSATPGTYSAAGQPITYHYTVNNVGSTPLYQIAVHDNKVATVTCTFGSLPAGGSTPCTGTYTTTVADAAAGMVTNTATVTGTETPTGGSTITSTPPTTFTINETGTSPSISVAKSTPTTGFDVGQTINYSYTVTNTGSTNLTAVNVTDTLIPTVTCPSTTLPASTLPGHSEVCTGSYTATAADFAAGHITNTAIAHGTDPFMTVVNSAPSSVTIPAEALSLTKSSVSTGFSHAGQPITYLYDITNTGTAALTGVTVSDSLSPPEVLTGCVFPTVAAGATVSCTGVYTTTAADVAAGSVTNTATAHGTDPHGGTITSPPSSVTLPFENITLVKGSTATGYSAAGQHIHYTYLVSNPGTTKLNHIKVTDSLVNPVTCPKTFVLPGGHMTCTGTYTVTAADVTAGHITNTATVSGDDPDGNTITSTPPSSLTLHRESLSLTKATTTTGYSGSGEVINYTYVVTNTGTTALSGITVTDNKVPAVNCGVPPVNLAAGAHVNCTGSYTTTAGDANKPSVINTAVATGTDSGGSTITSNVATHTVPRESLSLVKSTTSTGFSQAGQNITYSYRVTNTGTTTLTGIAVSDDTVATVTCPLPSLAPGAHETCTGVYTTTQADVDTGSVTNVATASGSDGHMTITSNPSTVTVRVVGATSSINLTKSTTSTGFSGAGQNIPYSYAVKNTGTTSISGIAVSDNKVATVNCPALPPAGLAPGNTLTCTGVYTTTPADVTAGSVTNTATAMGTNPSRRTVTSNTVKLTVPFVRSSSSLSLTKSTTSTGYTTAGQVLHYSYLINNTGTTTLTNVGITDNKVPAASISGCPVATLLAGASATCTGTYTTTAADVTAGSVTNVATAHGTDPTPTTITSNSSTVTVHVRGTNSSLSLTKSLSPAGQTYSAAGQTLTYSYLITNTGATNLTNVGITDNKVPAASIIGCPVATLTSGSSVTCTGTYTTTATDVSAGSVTNTATAQGTTPTLTTVTSNPSTVTVSVTQSTVGLSLLKSSNSQNFKQAGQNLMYSYLVTNRTKGTLHSVAVSDNLIPSVHCPMSSLLAGQSEACSGTYKTTAADVATGSVTNTATASAVDASNNPVTSNSSSVTVLDH